MCWVVVARLGELWKKRYWYLNVLGRSVEQGQTRPAYKEPRGRREEDGHGLDNGRPRMGSKVREGKASGVETRPCDTWHDFL